MGAGNKLGFGLLRRNGGKEERRAKAAGSMKLLEDRNGLDLQQPGRGVYPSSPGGPPEPERKAEADIISGVGRGFFTVALLVI